MIIGLAGDTVLLNHKAATCSVRPRAVATCILFGSAFFSKVIPTLAFEAPSELALDPFYLLQIDKPLVMALLAASTLLSDKRRCAVF